MNTKHKLRALLAVVNLLFRVCIALVFCSCDPSLFSNPQPIDAKNVYEFPKQFRGTWVDDGDTITIGTDYYRSSTGNETKIINGIYINPADTLIVQKGDTIAALKRNKMNRYFQSLQRIHYDSVNNPIDTVTNYIIKRDKIYKVIRHRLEEGTLFDLKNDTIYTRERTISLLELGRNNFLRQVSENRYIVNLNGRNPYNDGDNHGWWTLILLEKTVDGTINISSINHQKVSDSEEIYSGGEYHYFNSLWTKQQVVKLIQDSIFNKDEIVLDYRMKVKKK